jgi:hypothetical protein
VAINSRQAYNVENALSRRARKLNRESVVLCAGGGSYTAAAMISGRGLDKFTDQIRDLKSLM